MKQKQRTAEGLLAAIKGKISIHKHHFHLPMAGLGFRHPARCEHSTHTCTHTCTQVHTRAQPDPAQPGQAPLLVPLRAARSHLLAVPHGSGAAAAAQPGLARAAPGAAPARTVAMATTRPPASRGRSAREVRRSLPCFLMRWQTTRIQFHILFCLQYIPEFLSSR